MSSLFVNENGAVISFGDNYVMVTYKDGLLRKIPVESLEAIYLLDSVQVTSQCVVQCLKHGISLSYCSKSGNYFGKLQSTGHVNVFRQRKQAALAGTDFALALAKNIIAGKIHNQEVLLRRYSRNRSENMDDVLNGMRNSLNKIQDCTQIRCLF